ncbi:uncharacterized protein VICG_01075 [Vittaforma corneae ATCC 50505]|uniref:Yos1-like protein n=1 Tax=Vittaforma corneae (strain ATCC 50505) TaxID=993615 RepID=L2GM20_VITCO|nr:uncharacterized protein VICG_01075 [Vittaforma corneae ATCC 50505]ELA41891.1 hypothetical protein VICG_01075 [Vittaforma corneae ATCC 50505]
MFGLISLLYSVVLILNAFIILDDRRFLSRIGLSLRKEHRSALHPTNRKIVEVIAMVKTLEIPLVAANILFMIYELF